MDKAHPGTRSNATGEVPRTFKRTVERYGLIKPGDTLLAACSGGPDSIALVDLLLDLRREMPFEVAVAHFDHRLRPDSPADAAFVRERAKALGLRFFFGRRDVRAFARRESLNLEEAARILRYEFLRGAAKKAGATRIATGHTLTDQAETLLMRLLRGTGLTGLGGIQPVANDGLIRPLIEIEKTDLEAYLRERDLAFRRDETNADRRLFRNRIRLELLPFLEEKFESRVVRHLGRLALILQDEERVMEDVANTVLGRTASWRQGSYEIDARELAALRPGLARRVVRAYLRELRGDLRGITFEDVEEILALADGREKTVRQGLVVHRRGGRIARKVETADTEAKVFSRRWDGLSEFEIPEAGLRVRGQRLKPGERLVFDDRRRAYFDLKKLVFPLEIRSRKPGDAYRPLGAPGRKKLSEGLRDKGVPQADRDRTPVFVSGFDIVWAPGLPVANNYRVTALTKAILLIEIL